MLMVVLFGAAHWGRCWGDGSSHQDIDICKLWKPLDNFCFRTTNGGVFEDFRKSWEEESENTVNLVLAAATHVSDCTCSRGGINIKTMLTHLPPSEGGDRW